MNLPDNARLQFNISEPLPKELEGKTLAEVFAMARVKTTEINAKIKKRTGNTIYTPEVEKMLTEDEKIYLRLDLMFKNIADGDLSSIGGISSPYHHD